MSGEKININSRKMQNHLTEFITILNYIFAYYFAHLTGIAKYIVYWLINFLYTIVIHVYRVFL